MNQREFFLLSAGVNFKIHLWKFRKEDEFSRILGKVYDALAENEYLASILSNTDPDLGSELAEAELFDFLNENIDYDEDELEVFTTGTVDHDEYIFFFNRMRKNLKHHEDEELFAEMFSYMKKMLD